MIYYSGTGLKGKLSFTQALLAGVGADGSAIVPEVENPLPRPFFKNMAEMTSRDVAYVVANAIMGGDFSPEQLRRLVDEWIVDDFELRRAGDNLYAFEALKGPTMSEYDLIGRLFAVVLRHLYDLRAVSIDSVFFSPSRGDSCAAISQAFKSVIGKSPVMFQATGVLTELEKRQLAYIVPRDMLFVVGCGEDALDRLCRRVMSQTTHGVMIADCNPLAVAARVFMYFEAYRLLLVNETEGDVVVCADSSNPGDGIALLMAVKLGLPIKVIQSPTDCDVDAAILTAYKESGYIVCPRSAAQWSELRADVTGGKTGVFIQHTHPAKSRLQLEPLLNRVIALPHRLHFNEVSHVKYKRLAPSVNVLKNCLINY